MDKKIEVAALGDLHVHAHGPSYAELFAEIAEKADVLVLCGDLTNLGLPEEAKHLANDITKARLPIVGVLGNHDFESGQADEVRKILVDAGMLDIESEAHEVAGVGFAGAKGFGGGFGKYSLGFFGERPIKAFVQESMDEALRLENRLHELSDAKSVVVALHYSPISQTLEGEPKEIWPYLGSTRLEETIDRFENVKAVFHGHAHHGSEKGATAKQIPVHNCAIPVAKETGRQYSLLTID
jgi:Icc-related predicted phosphoesterase